MQKLSIQGVRDNKKLIELTLNMISNEELTHLFRSVNGIRNPSNLFELQTLHIISRGFNVKLGSRKVYVDFPRVVYFIQQEIMEILTDRISQGFSEGKTLEDILNEITNEKKDPKIELGRLTNCLEKLGIKWSCVYLPWYKKPVLRFYTNEYFKKLWIAKLKQFVRELNAGDDNPVKIYEKARTLTPEYKKIQEKIHVKPKIFEIFLSSRLSPYAELEHIWKASQKLRKLINLEKYKNPIIYEYIDRIFADIKTIIHQIYTILESGHCFSGYILLRKLLINFALIIFQDSLINWLHKQGIKAEIKASTVESDIIMDYVSNFTHKWKLIYLHKDLIVYKDIGEDARTDIKITDINVFKSLYKKGQLLDVFREKYVDLRDAFLRQSLDVVVTFSIDVFEFAEKDYKLNTDNTVVSDEYRKLGEVVHEPIHIDFPPFSSLLEYIGFLYHLRKVRHLLSLIVKSYKKAKRRTDVNKSEVENER